MDNAWPRHYSIRTLEESNDGSGVQSWREACYRHGLCWTDNDDLSTSSVFYVIEAKTSYKLLLGRRRFYDHRIVASTLHQCLKYDRYEERKINDNIKPFTKDKSPFENARFFKEDDAPKRSCFQLLLPWTKVAWKIPFYHQRKVFPNTSLRMKKAKRDDTPSSVKKANNKSPSP